MTKNPEVIIISDSDTDTEIEKNQPNLPKSKTNIYFYKWKKIKNQIYTKFIIKINNFLLEYIFFFYNVKIEDTFSNSSYSPVFKLNNSPLM